MYTYSKTVKGAYLWVKYRNGSQRQMHFPTYLMAEQVLSLIPYYQMMDEEAGVVTEFTNIASAKIVESTIGLN